MHDACLEALKNCENKLKPGNKVGEVFDIHAKKTLMILDIINQE